MKIIAFALVVLSSSISAQAAFTCSANCGYFDSKVAGATLLYTLPIQAQGDLRREALDKLETNCKKRNPAGFVYIGMLEAADGYVLHGGYSKKLKLLKESPDAENFACIEE